MFSRPLSAVTTAVTVAEAATGADREPVVLYNYNASKHLYSPSWTIPTEIRRAGILSRSGDDPSAGSGGNETDPAGGGRSETAVLDEEISDRNRIAQSTSLSPVVVFAIGRLAATGRGTRWDRRRSSAAEQIPMCDYNIVRAMVSDQITHGRSRCRNCGFEAPGGDDEWRRIEVPKLGRMTQCPNCESTDIITSR